MKEKKGLTKILLTVIAVSTYVTFITSTHNAMELIYAFTTAATWTFDLTATFYL